MQHALPSLTDDQVATLWDWIYQGSPAPAPHFVKMALIQNIARQTDCSVFVETGTHYGLTTEFLANDFSTLYTIELSDELFRMASNRLKKFPNVQQLQGDSSAVLFDLVPRIDTPALFWLDGHYSGGKTAKGRCVTPILEELIAVYRAPWRHVVLIDDVRLFQGDEYPTLAMLQEFIRRIVRFDVTFRITHDIMACIPDPQPGQPGPEGE